MRTRHLPVLPASVQRRVVLRGMAAALLASLAGCRIDLDHRDPEAAQPDAGAGVEQDGDLACGGAVCLDLSDPSNAALAQIDGARIIAIAGGRRLLVVRTAENEFVALSAICTHAGCTVRYAAAQGDVECPCHGSTFTLDGAVTRGPATTPLARFATQFDAVAGVVTITA
jgi:cytochrome b6-f complex iron-sulfur subunit